MDVKDKVVLITGGSEGIGKATAQLLDSKGALVAVAARSLEKLNEVVSGFENGLAVQADMTQPESITDMVKQVVDHYGRIDILINGAGRALRAPITEIRISDFDEIMQLNVYGPLLAMQAVVPSMQKNGGGAIINVSSDVSKRAIPTIGAYAATKAALNGLSLIARAELADKNIVVSLMYPGLTATNFGKHAKQYESVASSRPPSGATQPDTPEQVAEKILEAIETGPAEQDMSSAE
jgi:NAD(P)-dependent dehydrogenase (short-subunit alcohol dehydrogenase family)